MKKFRQLEESELVIGEWYLFADNPLEEVEEFQCAKFKGILEAEVYRLKTAEDLGWHYAFEEVVEPATSTPGNPIWCWVRDSKEEEWEKAFFIADLGGSFSYPIACIGSIDFDAFLEGGSGCDVFNYKLCTFEDPYGKTKISTQEVLERFLKENPDFEIED